MYGYGSAEGDDCLSSNSGDTGASENTLGLSYLSISLGAERPLSDDGIPTTQLFGPILLY